MTARLFASQSMRFVKGCAGRYPGSSQSLVSSRGLAPILLNADLQSANIWTRSNAMSERRQRACTQRFPSLGHATPPTLSVENGWSLQHRRTIAGPVARILAQLAVSLSAAVGRAFVVAFMQQRAQMKAGKGGAAQAAKTVMTKDAMTRAQALEILNVDESATKEEIQSNYEKYFAANDPAKGGSFYLQSKIYRAKEFLDAEGKGNQDNN